MGLNVNGGNISSIRPDGHAAENIPLKNSQFRKEIMNASASSIGDQQAIAKGDALQLAQVGGKEAKNAAELASKAKSRPAAYGAVMYTSLEGSQATDLHFKALALETIKNLREAFRKEEL